MKSMSQEDLAKVVPHVGLSDVGIRPPNAHRTPNKVLKSMGKWVEHGMPSLRNMWEESRGMPQRGDRGSQEKVVESGQTSKSLQLADWRDMVNISRTVRVEAITSVCGQPASSTKRHT
ncbi:hypothetical protein N0V94_005308 [Neodidymelliopsis sp. IMI 364377]|nr:hypothetical protein N0V94_005308 [Neodidymelliopsis sp. IMI 364377]